MVTSRTDVMGVGVQVVIGCLIGVTVAVVIRGTGAAVVVELEGGGAEDVGGGGGASVVDGVYETIVSGRSA